MWLDGGFCPVAVPPGPNVAVWLTSSMFYPGTAEPEWFRLTVGEVSTAAQHILNMLNCNFPWSQLEICLAAWQQMIQPQTEPMGEKVCQLPANWHTNCHLLGTNGMQGGGIKVCPFPVINKPAFAFHLAPGVCVVDSVPSYSHPQEACVRMANDTYHITFQCIVKL